MTRKDLKGLIALASILAVIGFILMFFSVDFGTSLAGNWLAQRGGVETSIYLIAVEGYIENFLVSGSILFGIALAVVTFSYYKLLETRE
ncbi:hypothetical protein [Halobacillus salinus]|uniref:Phosphatase n=1 Tax=Halobacillus salinus TaxID=192814 RepID=A0A4Z0H2L6_9BACI|nr:hypothetical protein [Halobacillus salinus]TGB03651.1 hypothetical protein E4663_01205 [Halobacillus salinus]